MKTRQRLSPVSAEEKAMRIVLVALIVIAMLALLLGMFADVAAACYSPELCPPPVARYQLYLPLIVAGSLGPWDK